MTKNNNITYFLFFLIFVFFAILTIIFLLLMYNSGKKDGYEEACEDFLNGKVKMELIHDGGKHYWKWKE